MTDTYKAMTAQFAVLMTERLDENEAKQGNFEIWNPDRNEALGLLTKNLGNMIQAMNADHRDSVSKSCADMANYAMKIHQLFGNPKVIPHGRGD